MGFRFGSPTGYVGIATSSAQMRTRSLAVGGEWRGALRVRSRSGHWRREAVMSGRSSGGRVHGVTEGLVDELPVAVEVDEAHGRDPVVLVVVGHALLVVLEQPEGV